jgi:hypothetical protein
VLQGVEEEVARVIIGWRDERVAMSVLSADVDGVCIVLSQKIIDGIAYKEIKVC